MGDELRGDRDAGAGVERDDLVVHGRQVAVLERGQAAGADEDALAARRLPLDLALEHAGLHVEHALEAMQPGGGQVEGLVVDEQADDRAVGGVDDRLAGAGQTVGVLGVDDRPRLVQPVERHPGVVGRAALLGRASQAEVAVGHGEDGLERGQRLGREAALDDLPVGHRVDALGGRARQALLEALAQQRGTAGAGAHRITSATVTADGGARRAIGIGRR